MKKFICILLAAAMLCCIAACGETSGKGTTALNTPSADGDGDTAKDTGTGANGQNSTIGDTADTYGYKPDTVMLTFNGDGQASLTILQLTALDTVSLTDGNNTEFAGFSVADVLKLAGVADAASLTLTCSDGTTKTIELASIDVNASVFAISKAGVVFGMSASVRMLLVCKDVNGAYSYDEINDSILVSK